MTVLSLLAAGEAFAAVTRETLREDKRQVYAWNRFVDACYALHERRLAGREVRTGSELGGYEGMPDFYKEARYCDAATGRLLGRVQWEREHPDRLHAIEVYVYDGQGRVIRDYAAAFLPGYRNAPVQTLINLHRYNGGLHAFRRFDASGNRIYEFCEGGYRGRTVTIRLFDDDLMAVEGEAVELMGSPVYEACFGGLPLTAGSYVAPH